MYKTVTVKTKKAKIFCFMFINSVLEFYTKLRFNYSTNSHLKNV